MGDTAKIALGCLLFIVMPLVVAACFRIPPNTGGGGGGGLTTKSWELDGCNLFWRGEPTGRTERKCYRDRRWRDASALSECPNAEKNGLLCYPPCREGFSGAGPVCWQRCPEGYTDDGAFCRRNAHIISADNSRCPSYDLCGLTFSRGCSKCPEGYQNDGCTCRRDVHIFAKETHTRGVGSPMSCAAGKEQIAALCYGDCPSGYRKDGVYCEALTETCMDVPVETKPDYSVIRPYCFELRSSPSSCFTWGHDADSLEHARRLAQCECENCTVTDLDCSQLIDHPTCR
jgi:hypothetical protein